MLQLSKRKINAILNLVNKIKNKPLDKIYFSILITKQERGNNDITRLDVINAKNSNIINTRDNGFLFTAERVSKNSRLTVSKQNDMNLAKLLDWLDVRYKLGCGLVDESNLISKSSNIDNRVIFNITIPGESYKLIISLKVLFIILNNIHTVNYDVDNSPTPKILNNIINDLSNMYDKHTFKYAFIVEDYGLIKTQFLELGKYMNCKLLVKYKHRTKLNFSYDFYYNGITEMLAIEYKGKRITYSLKCLDDLEKLLYQLYDINNDTDLTLCHRLTLQNFILAINPWLCRFYYPIIH